MFWTDINTDQLWKSRLDGTDARLLLGTGLRTPGEINSHLRFFSCLFSALYVCFFCSQHLRKLFVHGLFVYCCNL